MLSHPLQPAQWRAFLHGRCVAHGAADAVRQTLRTHPEGAYALLFDEATGAQFDLDLRAPDTPQPLPSRADVDVDAVGPADQAPAAPRSVGRPRLGVVAREVTLLPRHWDWLSQQPGGASVTLRKLVEAARRQPTAAQSRAAACERTYRPMSALASHLPGFEEASRALFAGDGARFAELIAPWPADVQAFLRQLSAAAWVNP